MPVCQTRADQGRSNRRQGESGMTQIIAGTKTEFSIDPAIMQLLPTQGSIELQRDAAGKVHHFHTHPVDEILVIISGRLNFMWEGGERICGAGDTSCCPPARFTNRRRWTTRSMRLRRVPPPPVRSATETRVGARQDNAGSLPPDPGAGSVERRSTSSMISKR